MEHIDGPRVKNPYFPDSLLSVVFSMRDKLIQKDNVGKTIYHILLRANKRPL